MKKFTKWNQTLIVKELEANGFKRDQYKNLIKEVNGKKYRMKFQDNSIRLEVSSTTRWIRLATVFYRQLIIDKKENVTLLHGFVHALRDIRLTIILSPESMDTMRTSDYEAQN